MFLSIFKLYRNLTNFINYPSVKHTAPQNLSTNTIIEKHDKLGSNSENNSTSFSDKPSTQAYRKAREISKSKYGREDAFEFISQKIERNLDAPMSKYIPQMLSMIGEKSRELSNFLDRSINSADDPDFKTIKTLYYDWLEANKGYSGVVAIHHLEGDIIEVARQWQDRKTAQSKVDQEEEDDGGGGGAPPPP